MKTDILIPCWAGNNKKELKESLDSLINNEVLINKIIIIIDGCKTFPRYLPENHILKEKILIVYQYNNRGPGVARNTGVIFSKAQNIIFLDTGDMCTKDRLKLQINSLRGHSVSLGDIKEIDNKNNVFVRKSSRNKEEALKAIAFKNPFNNVTLAIKRKDFIKINGYPNIRTAEDWVLMGKILKNHLSIFIEKDVLVIIKLDNEFISRRSGSEVYKEIRKAIFMLFELGLMGKKELFLSLFIQKITRKYLPLKILKLIYKILRK